jgi:anthranilate phosphoribosyltransferase
MFSGLLEKLTRHEDLTEEEAAAAMTAIMDGRAEPAEIVGLARTMRARAVKLSRPFSPVFDMAGTGGDRSGTFNISSAASVVIAACGVRVAKHGNRSVSSQCGSADVFEALGVAASAPPECVEACLDGARLAFLFAPTFHPSMRHAAPVRKQLGVRTAFNLLGPLTNPTIPSRQIVGVPRPELTELMARALLQLGSERAWVVHGADGLDEISTTGYTKVSECRGGTVNTFYIHPSDAGLPKGNSAALKGGDAATNAGIIRQVLGGSKSPARDVVLFNAGAALFVAGAVTTLKEGVEGAAAAIDRGDAARTLEVLAAVSHGGVDDVAQGFSPAARRAQQP